MIGDIERFVAQEGVYWKELERVLDTNDNRTSHRMSLEEAQRFFYLYERCSAALARLAPMSVDPALRAYVESLVARAYADVHEVRRKGAKARPIRWFVDEFPKIFRAHLPAFTLSVALTVAGCAFGVIAMAVDSNNRRALMPFPALLENPAQRVKREQSVRADRLTGHKSEFSAQLMTHNTQVTIFTLALGVTFGAGTTLVLFYNGVMLGAVVYDYLAAGQGVFLTGWLLPHGSVEIPAILIGGQAGFVLAGALIGWGSRLTRRERLRRVGPDLVTLIGGAAALLVWAGIVEAFFSQYHEPILPYALKISFGVLQLTALAAFLSRSGLKQNG